MIRIQQVSKSYSKAGKKAVDQLSLELRDGEIFGLLGPNGAGKSTLIKMLVGILSPDEGSISINGKPMDGSAAVKREFCYVSDTPDNLMAYKGYEFLRFIADVYKVPLDARIERIEQLAKDLGMEHELDNPIQSYSHGMRQKMMVMGALLPNPNVWILDEPMTGLDPRSSFILKEKMRAHADQGKTVLFSTHVLEVAEKLVDRVGVISKGKLLFVGTVEELRRQRGGNESLEQMFLELTESAEEGEDSAGTEGN